MPSEPAGGDESGGGRKPSADGADNGCASRLEPRSAKEGSGQHFEHALGIRASGLAGWTVIQQAGASGAQPAQQSQGSFRVGHGGSLHEKLMHTLPREVKEPCQLDLLTPAPDIRTNGRCQLVPHGSIRAGMERCAMDGSLAYRPGPLFPALDRLADTVYKSFRHHCRQLEVVGKSLHDTMELKTAANGCHDPKPMR